MIENNNKTKIINTIKNIVIIMITLIVLFPVIIIIINSISDGNEIANYFSKLGAWGDKPFIGIKIIPNMINIKQYYAILIEEQNYLRYFVNSSAYATLTVLGQVLIAPLAAYAFAKFEFRFRNTLFFLYIIVMMMPFQAIMIPNYIAIKNLGLYDTGWSLILPGIFAPFSVFLMRQYMLSVPDEIMEASRIDGAGTFSVYYKIVLPMVAPGLAAMVVLCFVEAWNLIEQPLLFISTATKYPLSIMLNDPGVAPMNLMFAGSVLFMAPVVILFMIFREHIIHGIEKINFKD